MHAQEKGCSKHQSPCVVLPDTRSVCHHYCFWIWSAHALLIWSGILHISLTKEGTFWHDYSLNHLASQVPLRVNKPAFEDWCVYRIQPTFSLAGFYSIILQLMNNFKQFFFFLQFVMKTWVSKCVIKMFDSQTQVSGTYILETIFIVVAELLPKSLHSLCIN